MIYICVINYLNDGGLKNAGGAKNAGGPKNDGGLKKPGGLKNDGFAPPHPRQSQHTSDVTSSYALQVHGEHGSG